MIRFKAAMLGVALVACATAAHAADACYAVRDTGVSAEQKIAACAALIKAGDLHGLELANVYANRADGYYWAEKLDLAIADYDQALTTAGDAAAGWTQTPAIIGSRGFAYADSHRPAAAIADFKKVLTIRPRWGDAHLGLGRAYFQIGTPGKARAELDEAIALQPALAVAYVERGTVNFEMGENTRALQDLGYAILLNPKLGWAYANRGRAYYAAGQYDLAVQDFTHALTLMPKNALITQGLDKAKTAAAAWAERLAAPMPTARGMDAANLPSRAVGRTHDCSSLYPDISRHLGETGSVLVRYDVASDGTIDRVSLVRTSGSDRLDRAAIACVVALWRNLPAVKDGTPIATPGHQALIVFSLHGDNSAATDLENSAQGHYILGEFDTALSAIDRALEITHGDGNLYYQRGLIEYFLGQYDRAIADYDQALTLLHDPIMIQLTHDARDLAKSDRGEPKPKDAGKSI